MEHAKIVAEFCRAMDARQLSSNCLDVQRRHDEADARRIFRFGRHEAIVADGAANSNQLCADSPALRGRIMASQTKNSAPKASPAVMGITRSNSAGDLPRNKSASQ